MANMCFHFQERNQKIKSTEIEVDFEDVGAKPVDFSFDGCRFSPSSERRGRQESQSSYYRSTYQSQELSEDLLTAVI